MTFIVYPTTKLIYSGNIYFAQRFAIDWVKMNNQGLMVNGDVANLK